MKEKQIICSYEDEVDWSAKSGWPVQEVCVDHSRAWAGLLPWLAYPRLNNEKAWENRMISSKAMGALLFYSRWKRTGMPRPEWAKIDKRQMMRRVAKTEYLAQKRICDASVFSELLGLDALARILEERDIAKNLPKYPFSALGVSESLAEQRHTHRASEPLASVGTIRTRRWQYSKPVLHLAGALAKKLGQRPLVEGIWKIDIFQLLIMSEWCRVHFQTRFSYPIKLCETVQFRPKVDQI